jgi:hypothetical protein
LPDYDEVDFAWFSGGRLNACYNCVDRHLKTKAEQTAIIWAADEPGVYRHITYREMKHQVCRMANVLHAHGVRKGDRFDIYIEVPPDNDTTSLAGGWLMETRLNEMAVIGNTIRDGHELGVAEGPLLVDPVSGGTLDSKSKIRARVPGGGVALTDRDLGLVLAAEHRSFAMSKRLGDWINRRALRLSRMLRLPLYDAHRYFCSGWASHSHIGNITETMVDFECRGGMLMSSLRSSPALIASKCSQIASMCQLAMN